MKSITTILLTFCCGILVSCTDTSVETELQQLKAQLEEAKAQLAIAEAPQPEFIHTVFFWLKEDVSAEERATFMEGLESLRAIESVKRSWIGPAAQTPREVVDNTYDMALILH